MPSRFTAALALVAFVLGANPAPAATKKPVPAPTATPLKTIEHLYVKPLCTALRRSVGPAIRSILQNDHSIAVSRPLFQDYVRSTSSGSQGAVDMDVMRLERLIDPLVKNTDEIDRLLGDPVYRRKPQTDSDKQLLQMRAHLKAVLEEQKRALDLVSGFVDTEQLGELQAAGHEYDSAINSPDTKNSGAGGSNSQTPQTSPTQSPADILNAGLSTQNDPGRKYDPRFFNTGSQVGYNPLNIFDQAMEEHQATIYQSEQQVTQDVFKAVPQCGGQVPPSPTPPPPPAPVPATVPATLPTASPTPKP